MSGIFSISVAEARGFSAVNADIDRLAVVIGCTSAGSGLSPFFLSGPAAVAALGYGDAVDTLSQIIEQRQDSGTGTKYPAALYTVTGTTAGAYGTINVTGVTGTSVITNDAAVHPFGTYEARLRVVTGGIVGTTGITVAWSLDGGRSESVAVALGTANTFTIPNSNVKFNLAAGNLAAGDIATVRTTAPAPSATDIDNAFAALVAASIDFSLVVCEFPMTATLAAHVTTGLNLLAGIGKRATALVRTRIRNFDGAETEATWGAAVQADFASFVDSRICVSAAYGFVTDAVTSRIYLRSDLAQWAADVVRVGRALLPDVPADQPEAGYSLVDTTGATIGHDEGPRGTFTGLSNDTTGNRFRSTQRFPDFARRESVYSTVPWVMYASDERIRTLPVRRLANAIERVAVSAGTSALGGAFFYIPGPPPTLTAASRTAIQGLIFSALRAQFASEISNATDAALDTGLVQVSPAIVVTGGNLLNVSVTIAPRIAGFLLTLSITLAVQQ